MDATSFIAVLGLTLLFVGLCAGGIYANTQRNKRKEHL